LGWPAEFATDRADGLGFGRDTGIDEIIEAHIRAASHG
jgi:hypothetical protein